MKVRFSTFRVRCSRHFDILDIHFNDERRERLGQEDYERMEALAKEETLKKRFTEPAGAQLPFRGSGHRGGTAVAVNIFLRGSVLTVDRAGADAEATDRDPTRSPGGTTLSSALTGGQFIVLCLLFKTEEKGKESLQVFK